MIYVLICIAGAIGALIRYAIGALIPSTYFMEFPVSTLSINLTGSFGLSWFYTWTTKRISFPNWARTTIATGFIGSYTTFSTFNIELIQLVEKNQLLFAVIYFICSIIGGYFFSWLGYEVAKNKDRTT